MKEFPIELQSIPSLIPPKTWSLRKRSSFFNGFYDCWDPNKKKNKFAYQQIQQNKSHRKQYKLGFRTAQYLQDLRKPIKQITKVDIKKIDIPQSIPSQVEKKGYSIGFVIKEFFNSITGKLFND